MKLLLCGGGSGKKTIEANKVFDAFDKVPNAFSVQKTIH